MREAIQKLVGWARMESTGKSIGGVSTFQFAPGGTVQTVAGVLGSQLVSTATIPVDDDVSQSRFAGYAVSNSSDSSITINVVEISADGNTITPQTSITLDSGKQTVAFFLQDPKAAQMFRGSAVLTGQGGSTFSVVVLVEVQCASGLLKPADSRQFVVDTLLFLIELPAQRGFFMASGGFPSHDRSLSRPAWHSCCHPCGASHPVSAQVF